MLVDIYQALRMLEVVLWLDKAILDPFSGIRKVLRGSLQALSRNCMGFWFCDASSTPSIGRQMRTTRSFVQQVRNLLTAIVQTTRSLII